MAGDTYEDDRFTGRCPSCGQEFYKEAFETAKAFIDSHLAGPDLSQEKIDRYEIYLEALGRLKVLQKGSV